MKRLDKFRFYMDQGTHRVFAHLLNMSIKAYKNRFFVFMSARFYVEIK